MTDMNPESQTKIFRGLFLLVMVVMCYPTDNPSIRGFSLIIQNIHLLQTCMSEVEKC